MEMAIQQAREQLDRFGLDEGGERPDPKVGCVVVTKDGRFEVGYRGEMGSGDHAEFTVMEKKMPYEVLAGATVFTTLEPCTKRKHPKKSCADRIIEREIGRVVIGMMDPDDKGQGLRKLDDARIEVAHFPSDLKAQIRELNRRFLESRRKPALDHQEASRTSTDRPVASPITYSTQTSDSPSNKHRFDRSVDGKAPWGKVVPHVVAPSSDALELLKKFPSDRYWAVGSVIEIDRSPDMGSSPATGWRPEDVALVPIGQEFVSPFPRATDFEGKDGDKFCLGRSPYVVSDAGNTVTLQLFHTNYSTIKGALKIVGGKGGKGPRHQHSNLDPQLHRIPNTLCFHFVSTTSDGQILGLIRRQDNPDKLYNVGKVSFSAEEQLNLADMSDEQPAQHWLIRTVTQELFGFTSDAARSDLPKVESLVDWARCRFWSIFFEEDVGNFSISGFIPLSIPLEQYRNTLNEFRSLRSGHEYEGDRCILALEQALSLLSEGKGRITRLRTGEQMDLGLSQCHSSSIYRLNLYARAVQESSRW